MNETQKLLTMIEAESKMFLEFLSKNNFDFLSTFPTGTCKQVSFLFGAILLRKRYVRADELYLVGSLYNEEKQLRTGHFWLEANNIIIDLTAGQFLHAPERFYVTLERTWHCTFENQNRFPFASEVLKSNKVLQMRMSNISQMYMDSVVL